MVPPFDNTAVDGYAVRAADTAGAPVELQAIGVLAAGAAPDTEVGPGQALRIMTGAPLPPGADAVAMVEDSEVLPGGRVRLHRTVQPGDAVRRTGDDVMDGDIVLVASTELRPAHLGVLASIGVLEVEVFPKARVGVISTGDELVEGGAPLRPGQIRESNRPMLLALVAQAGAEPIDLGLVRDDEQVLAGALEQAAASCDALVTSGGVSMGDFDVVKLVLDKIARMQWMQIAIKPAKPFAFGLLEPDATPVFGLPGNPVSSLVSFELFARPALRQMMGHRRPGRPEVLAVADEGLPRRPDGKAHFTRVHASFEGDGRCHVRSVGAQGSHQLAATASAGGLAVVPDGDGVPPGGDVRVLLLGSL
jgi:molybdenum cofactor synthesis domain-containing protein